MEYEPNQQYDIWAVLESRASIIFDLDNEGDLDIVTKGYNDVSMVLIKDLTARKDCVYYFKITLVHDPEA